MRAGEGQTVIDVAIAHLGSATAAWALAVASGVSVTDEVGGATLADGCAVAAKGVRKHYQGQGIAPAGGLSDGVGGWRVGAFRVS